MNRLLIVGNGMASVRFVEELLRLAPGRFDMTVVGAEPSPGYNRVILSALLAGDVSQDDIILRDRQWYEDNRIALITGDPVERVDPHEMSARLASGKSFEFDQCVFATGSHPIKLPLPGIDLPGVRAFRDLADVAGMEASAAKGEEVAVIGGGLLGIEAAYGLARRGADVTLVHVMDRLMERQLDATAAAMLHKAMTRKGVSVLLEKATVSIAGDVHAEGLRFKDGSAIDAASVICAVGIRPNADLARAAGLDVGKGIVVDDHMRASMPGFYAIGECAEHRGIAYGLVEPAYAQARSLAQHLAGLSEPFEGMILATNLKVSGVPVFSAGEFMEPEGAEIVTIRDRANGVYRKCVIREGKLIGCVLFGDTEDGLWYLELIRSGIDIAPARRMLIHGRAYAEPLLHAAVDRAA
jgi:nitrite reductase (NADH) large subunit